MVAKTQEERVKLFRKYIGKDVKVKMRHTDYFHQSGSPTAVIPYEVVHLGKIIQDERGNIVFKEYGRKAPYFFHDTPVLKVSLWNRRRKK